MVTLSKLYDDLKFGTYRRYFQAMAEGGGARQGVFVGKLAVDARIDGRGVTAEHMKRMFDQHVHPTNNPVLHLGRPPRPQSGRAFTGFHLTFAVDKLVASLLQAARTDEQRALIEACHTSAVWGAFEYMERFGCGGRSGDAQYDGRGFLGVEFVHLTGGDRCPRSLHTHVAVVNRTSTQYGWRALNARLLRQHVAGTGPVYKSLLLDRLAEQGIVG